jgi:hypothetical protein
VDEGTNPLSFLIYWNTGQDFPFWLALLAWNSKHVESVRMSHSQILLIVEVKKIIYAFTGHVDLGRFFSFLIHTQSVGLLQRGISPSQDRYLHTEQHKH